LVDTEAVLQESLLRAWQCAARVVPDGKPNALLRMTVRIARNLAISEVRRHRVRAVSPEVLESASRAAAERDGELPGGLAADPLLRAAIADCVARLPDKARAALLARIGAGAPSTDESLAAALGMIKNTFLQNFTRARQSLLACLQGKGVDVLGGRA
jgi:RNA polymerase sigma-70 factor (ECF subfamily)